jgi:hypothetical protein
VRGEAGPPGPLPSIGQVMPWLHLLFDAWEDYKRLREREATEAAEREASTYEALMEEPDEAFNEDPDEKEHRKKKKRHKNKDKHKK